MKPLEGAVTSFVFLIADHPDKIYALMDDWVAFQVDFLPGLEISLDRVRIWARFTP